MFAGCIDRMRQDACGGCERRDACALLLEAFRLDRTPRRTRPRRERSSRPSASPFLAFLGQIAKAIESDVRKNSAPPEGSFRRAVELKMEPLLPSGAVRIDGIARALGCSRQTLYRRLKAEGATFAQLLDGLRRRLALRFVRQQGLSVKEAAWRLGFSDPAAFSHAFKRWTGMSPSEARGRRA